MLHQCQRRKKWVSGTLTSFLLLCRCATCFQCPQCESKLHALLASEVTQSEQPLFNWYCFGCGWNSFTINLTASSRGDLIGIQTFILLIDSENRPAHHGEEPEKAGSHYRYFTNNSIAARNTVSGETAI